MDIGSVKTPADFGGFAYVVAQKTPVAQAVISVPTANRGDITVKAMTLPGDKVNKKSAKLQDVQQMTAAMNQFVEAMDSNIRFVVHQKKMN